jgi:hypothetical protein
LSPGGTELADDDKRVKDAANKEDRGSPLEHHAERSLTLNSTVGNMTEEL